MGEHLDVSLAAEELRGVNAERLGLGHMAGNKVGEAAGGIGDVRPFLVDQDFERGVDPPRPASGAQARGNSSDDHQAFGNHKKHQSRGIRLYHAAREY